MSHANDTALEDIDLDSPVDACPDTRELVLTFLRLPMEGKMTIVCAAGTGAKLVQRMRIRLSKLRKLAKDRKRVIRPFKMLKLSIVPSQDDPTKDLVTLIKTMHQHQVTVSKSLEEALTAISDEGTMIHG